MDKAGLGPRLPVAGRPRRRSTASSWSSASSSPASSPAARAPAASPSAPTRTCRSWSTRRTTSASRSCTPASASHEVWEQINALDDRLEEQLHYAFSPQLGYLTACPTNVGTGIRVGVMLHLPALVHTKQIDKVFRALHKINLAVRGLYGEGTQAVGDFYQISNQQTLGKSERELIRNLSDVVPQIIAYERQARQEWIGQRRQHLHDQVSRAYGVLKTAHTISSEETMHLLSSVRMGINLGLIDDLEIPTVNELFIHTQPAHLQKIQGESLEVDERNIARAGYLRRTAAPNGRHRDDQGRRAPIEGAPVPSSIVRLAADPVPCPEGHCDVRRPTARPAIPSSASPATPTSTRSARPIAARPRSTTPTTAATSGPSASSSGLRVADRRGATPGDARAGPRPRPRLSPTTSNPSPIPAPCTTGPPSRERVRPGVRDRDYAAAPDGAGRGALAPHGGLGHLRAARPPRGRQLQRLAPPELARPGGRDRRQPIDPVELHAVLGEPD